MEIQKEAFTGLMEYYKLLPLDQKREEVIDKLEHIISNYTKICTSLGTVPNMMLSKEMLNIKRNNLTEEEFLHALFAYLNTLEDISAQFIDKMNEVLEKN